MASQWKQWKAKFKAVISKSKDSKDKRSSDAPSTPRKDLASATHPPRGCASSGAAASASGGPDSRQQASEAGGLSRPCECACACSCEFVSRGGGQRPFACTRPGWAVVASSVQCSV
jgi:hypothetical protein